MGCGEGGRGGTEKFRAGRYPFFMKKKREISLHARRNGS
jgi:hypothetical protein